MDRGRRDRAALLRNLCRALDCEQWLAHQTDDAVQDGCGPTSRPRSARPRRVGRRARSVRHVRVGGTRPCPSSCTPTQFRARGVFVAAHHATARRVRTGRLGARRMDRDATAPSARRDDTDTDALLGDAGYTAAEIAALREEGVVGVTDVDRARRRRGADRHVQYEETGEFPVERGYIWTTCASVENGNPLFWDDDVADEITGGRSRRRRCCRCGSGPTTGRPGRTEPALPLQVHFDLKEQLRAARSGDDRQHDRLPRAGAPRRRAAHAPGPALGERAEDDEARHRPLLGDRRRVPQPARRARRRRVVHRLRLQAGGGASTTSTLTLDDVHAATCCPSSRTT